MLMNSKHILTSFGAVALALIGGGCEYFSPVTVPATDNSAPYSWVAVYTVADQWRGYDYAREWSGWPFNQTPDYTYVVDDPDELHMALSAAYDNGGAKDVKMYYQILLKCSDSSQWFGLTGLETLEASQNGTAGSTVDNGVWTGKAFTASDYFDQAGSCWWGKIGIDWQVRSEDFAGNVTWYPKARMFYDGRLSSD
jgi:hypothetical protein